MKTADSLWSLKVQARMKSTGETWWEACSVLGRRGGLVAGRNRAAKSKALSQERRKQEAMGIR
jgi:hypothetical protein